MTPGKPETRPTPAERVYGGLPLWIAGARYTVQGSREADAGRITFLLTKPQPDGAPATRHRYTVAPGRILEVIIPGGAVR